MKQQQSEVQRKCSQQAKCNSVMAYIKDDGTSKNQGAHNKESII